MVSTYEAEEPPETAPVWSLTLLDLQQEKKELSGHYTGSAARVFGKRTLTNETNVLNQLRYRVLTFNWYGCTFLTVHCFFLPLQNSL
jgi:hypothetical protein